MLEKLIDEEVLSALLLMSKNKKEGIEYIEFARHHNMFGATELLNRGYAKKIKISDDSERYTSNYKLTKKGIKYLNKLLKFSSREFN